MCAFVRISYPLRYPVTLLSTTIITSRSTNVVSKVNCVFLVSHKHRKTPRRRRLRWLHPAAPVVGGSRHAVEWVGGISVFNNNSDDDDDVDVVDGDNEAI